MNVVLMCGSVGRLISTIIGKTARNMLLRVRAMFAKPKSYIGRAVHAEYDVRCFLGNTPVAVLVVMTPFPAVMFVVMHPDMWGGQGGLAMIDPAIINNRCIRATHGTSCFH